MNRYDLELGVTFVMNGNSYIHPRMLLFLFDVNQIMVDQS